eukprot:14539951-Heterocapsa_arctica.AAC.1
MYSRLQLVCTNLAVTRSCAVFSPSALLLRMYIGWATGLARRSLLRRASGPSAARPGTAAAFDAPRGCSRAKEAVCSAAWKLSQ